MTFTITKKNEAKGTFLKTYDFVSENFFLLGPTIQYHIINTVESVICICTVKYSVVRNVALILIDVLIFEAE